MQQSGLRQAQIIGLVTRTMIVDPDNKQLRELIKENHSGALPALLYHGKATVDFLEVLKFISGQGGPSVPESHPWLDRVLRYPIKELEISALEKSWWWMRLYQERQIQSKKRQITKHLQELGTGTLAHFYERNAVGVIVSN